MKRTYCDCCGNEISATNPGNRGLASTQDVKFGRLAHEFKRISFVVNANIDKEINDECDLCKYCIIDAVKKLDDRPEAPACAPSP